MRIVYASNNSGGRWWLNDEDWKNLEKAGWKIMWQIDKVKEAERMVRVHPHMSLSTAMQWDIEDGDRFLGALATSAWKEFSSIDDAIEEFEHITGKNASNQGCPCCGSPHYFYED